MKSNLTLEFIIGNSLNRITMLTTEIVRAGLQNKDSCVVSLIIVSASV